jgi:hypothetical protein
VSTKYRMSPDLPFRNGSKNVTIGRVGRRAGEEPWYTAATTPANLSTLGGQIDPS